MIIPNKPTSRMQRYRTTVAGREVLAVVEGAGRWAGIRCRSVLGERGAHGESAAKGVVR